MTKQLSPQQQLEKRRKELHVVFNRAWSNVSLGHIKTLRELLSYIGLNGESHRDYASRGFKLDLSPEWAQWSIITAELYDKLDAAPDVDYEEIYKPLIADSLIESTGNETLALDTLKPKKPKISELVKLLLPPRNPKQIWDLYYFQQEAADRILYNILQLHHRSIMLRANTGDGKTACYGYVIRALIDLKWHEGKCIGPYPYFVITAASIVEQTIRVLRDKFGLKIGDEVLVSNYEQLRADLGTMFISEREIVEHGEPKTIYEWKQGIAPCLLLFDECQKQKNDSSIQAQLSAKYSSLKGINSEYTTQIFSSATPFSRISGAKCFAIATRIPFSYGMGKQPLNEKTWPAFASNIAQPGNMYDYDTTAMRKFLRIMDPYIVGFKNVRKKFHAINKIRQIQFETPEKARAYALAFEKYLEERARIHGDESIANAALLERVALLMFRMEASILKADWIAENLNQIVREGRAAVFADAFKPTIAKVVLLLNKKYGISRDKISLIWGGSDELGNKRFTKEEMRDILIKASKGEEISKRTLEQISKQLKYEASGLGNIPEELELGVQNRKQRQREIDRFQNGKSLFCLFTFGAGGAGLSLHHEFPSTRQRESIFGTTWNEMEVHQGLGRAPRLTSLSDTPQTIICYAGTIELRVLAKSAAKGGVLEEVIKHSELPTVDGIDETVVNDSMRIAGANIDDDDEEFGQEMFEEHEKEHNNDNDEGTIIDI